MLVALDGIELTPQAWALACTALDAGLGGFAGAPGFNPVHGGLCSLHPLPLALEPRQMTFLARSPVDGAFQLSAMEVKARETETGTFSVSSWPDVDVSKPPRAGH